MPSVTLYLLLSSFFFLVLFADFVPAAFDAYSDQRLFLSLTLVVLTALAMAWFSYRRALAVLLKSCWPFSLLLSSFFLAAFQYNFQPFYLIEPAFYALYFLAFGVLGGFLKEAGLVRESARATMLVAVIACFFYAAMTITVYLFAITGGFSSLNDLIPWGFANIRYWSHIATWLLPLFPLGLLVGPWKDNRLWRSGVAFTAAIWWWVIFLSSSRGSMVGLFIGFLLVCLCFGKSALPWVKLFVRFAIYGLLVWLVLSVLVPSLVFDDLHVRGVKSSSSGRMPMWQEAWAMSLQHLPFGMGPQSWLTHDILTDAYRSSKKFGHPHNMYLMWAAEYGWISVVGLVLLCSVALRRLWRKIAAARVGGDPNGLLLVGFAASVTGALVHAGVSAVFMAPGSMLVGLVVLSVFWALIHPGLKFLAESLRRRSSSVSESTSYFFVILFLLASSLWLLEVLRYRQAMVDDITYYQGTLLQEAWPRFWFHGNFPRHPSQMPPKN